MPKERGGLGLRSLKEMNQALVLKTIWKLAAGSDAQWVHALRAKYYPRGAFWSIQRRLGCSKLWKQIMQLRPLMAMYVAWKIGSGDQIPIYSQPWFSGWQELRATTAQQRGATVASLLNQSTRIWNFDALQSLFGYSKALQIATMESVTPSPEPASNTLLFTYSKKGTFSVRKAYQLLKGEPQSTANRDFWKWVWKGSKLTPKLRLFIWRGVYGALPVMAVLSVRIHHLSPMCPICKRERETVMHALFHCDFARRAWLISSVPLRTQGLTTGFHQTMADMVSTLSDCQMCSFVCTMWSIWRMRNEVLYGKKNSSIAVCKVFYEKEMEACQLKLLTMRLVPQTQIRQPSDIALDQTSVPISPQTLFQCYVDGAWDSGGKAGIGAYLLCNGAVVCWTSKAIEVVNPNQAEAKGVLEGYRLLVQWAKGEGTVYSDSMETVQSLHNRLPVINDWRSYEAIWAAWKMQTQEHRNLKIEFCSREHLGLQVAHRLAQQGKLYGWDTVGYNDPVFDLQQL